MKRKIPFLIAAFLIAAVVAVVGILLPYLRADSEMPEDGPVTVQQNGDGSFVLKWPAADRADAYLVEILQATQTEEKCLFSSVVEFPQCTVNHDLPETQLLFRIHSAVKYSVFGREKTRYGTEKLEIPAQLDIPEVTHLQWASNPDADTVDVTLKTNGADCCYVYQIEANGEYILLQTLQEENWTVQFGEDGILPIPESGEICRIGFAACREMPGLKLQGAVSAQMEVNRQDLLGTDLNVILSEEDGNRFTLRWDETKGDGYEVQRMDFDGNWVTVGQIAREEPRLFESETLPAFRELCYRVVAVGGQSVEDRDYPAESDVFTVTTAESPLYATIWPVKDLEAYFDGKRTVPISKVESGKAYCVVDERHGSFGVRIGDQIGYIDSNYCMINLPDYIGDLCSYRIENSESAIYMVHEFAIPNVTAVITAGYESVSQADGRYLVPLLYPAAKKLVTAAKNAEMQGYKLRIYDAFRPQKATHEIYNRTASVLHSAIPERTYTGVSVSSLQLPQPDENGNLTYHRVMTNDAYALNSFLAKGVSRHNLGVALDLTLESLDTGNALQMQTSMHDLSWYSVTSRNNANARKLASIMKEAGFAPLSTEWWHFQDDEAKKQLELPALWDGISAEGWTCDDIGWRYRDPSGVFYQNRTVQIGDRSYVFDENGYAVDGDISFG